MRFAFVTGALASGFTGAGLTALLIWVATVITGSPDPWAIAPALVAGFAAALAILTYLAEQFIHRRSLERKRSTGEPWAYRE